MDLSKAFALIRQYEGLKLHAYPDPASGGEPWTIGYGSTAGVYPGMVISKAEAETMMEKDALTRATLIQGWLAEPVTDNMMSAMISLAYNIGMGAFHHSQLLLSLNQGQSKETCAQDFMHFTHAAGRVIPGLVNRREEEMKVFLS